MRLALALGALASAGLVAANGKKGLGGGPAGAAIFARQTEFCTDGTTCAECYGEGNIVCEVSWCYNPDAGEQCCGDGSYCVGAPSCCGSEGLGTPGDDEPVLTPTSAIDDDDLPATTSLSSPPSTPSSWDCETSDTNEECCQRGDSAFSYCPGGDTLSSIVCFDPSSEVCCSDGTTCTGSADCCGAAGEAETSSVEEDATSRITTTRAGVTVVTQIPTTTRRTPVDETGAGNNDQPQSTGAANLMAAVESAAAIAAGVLGLAML